MRKRKCWQWCIGLCMALALIVAGFGLAANPPVKGKGDPCAAPSVSKTSQGVGFISYDWSAVSGATGYQVRYIRKENNYNSPVYNTTDTGIHFSDLPAGTYRFYFNTVCQGGISDFIIDDDLIIL